MTIGVLTVERSTLTNTGEVVNVINLQGSPNSQDSEDKVQEIKYEMGLSSPNDTILINNIRNVGGAYNSSFVCSPGNGTTLNIYVRNNNSTGVVKFNVYYGDKDFGMVDIGAKKGITRTFKMTESDGESSKWKVYVTTTDGHSIDINVNAKQK